MPNPCDTGIGNYKKLMLPYKGIKCTIVQICMPVDLEHGKNDKHFMNRRKMISLFELLPHISWENAIIKL